MRRCRASRSANRQVAPAPRNTSIFLRDSHSHPSQARGARKQGLQKHMVKNLCVQYLRAKTKYTAYFRVLLARDKHRKCRHILRIGISLLNGVLPYCRGSKAFRQKLGINPTVLRLKNQRTDGSENFLRSYE